MGPSGGDVVGVRAGSCDGALADSRGGQLAAKENAKEPRAMVGIPDGGPSNWYYEEIEMPTSAFTLCARFGLFPDNTTLGPSFQLAGFSFQELGAPLPNLFVNATRGSLGLQFPNQGLQVGLPVPVNSIDLRVGAFAGSFTVEGRDLNRNLVASHVVPEINDYIDVRLIGREIAFLQFTGGVNEGVLVQICIALPVC